MHCELAYKLSGGRSNFEPRNFKLVVDLLPIYIPAFGSESISTHVQ